MCSPWGERRGRGDHPADLTLISIHAPRGGSDHRPRGPGDLRGNFNPRSPWGERRLWRRPESRWIFYFNPRSPWGERHPCMMTNFSRLVFQSTLPVGGATAFTSSPTQPSRNFNPRSPWGERPNRRSSGFDAWRISIHAPRGGSDTLPHPLHFSRLYFNPRSPWGERHITGAFVAA